MNNPFQTPKANLELVEFQPPKPRAVILSIRIFWITLALGLLSLLPGIRTGYWNAFSGEKNEIFVGIMLLLITLVLGIFVTIIVHLGRRANWARWAMLAFVLLSWLANASDGPELVAQGKLAVAIDLGISIAEGYALILLFLGEGRKWFTASPEQ